MDADPIGGASWMLEKDSGARTLARDDGGAWTVAVALRFFYRGM